MNLYTKALLAILLSIFLPLSGWADFSDAKLLPHPRYPGAEPFILEITGNWANDCHPGEQKPVIESYDGLEVEVKFETVVEHVTCNDVETPYRILLDMSEAVRAAPPEMEALNFVLTFNGFKMESTLMLTCMKEEGCEQDLSNNQLAEPGLYVSQGLAKQGLLVARQNEAMAIYPLVYGKDGGGEWLFTGTTMNEDTFFTELVRFAGGSCLGCEESSATPRMTIAGQLSVLVDRPGLLQVKFDDGQFVTYESLIYGYNKVEVGTTDKKTLVDLEGRWAVSENRGSDTPLGDFMNFFPGAFDIEREKATTGRDAASGSGQVSYVISALSGQFIGQLVCTGETATDGSNMCAFIDPTDAAGPLFRVYLHGPTRLTFEYGRTMEADGVPPSGSAIRID